MSSYRGKRFKPASDDASPFEAESDNTAQTNKPRSMRARRAERAAEARTAGTPRKQARHASPDAFKPHDAVLEDGSSARHSKRKTLLIAIPIVVVVVAALVAAGFALSSFFAEEEEPNIQAGIAVTVTIPEGAGTTEIANTLKEANVISSTKDFIAEVQTRGVEQSLKPGTYELTTLMDTDELIELLVAGPVVVGANLTIPEGLTAEQTAAVVQEAVGIAQDEFLARVYAASDYVADYPFLEGVYNNSLEGFLYPKTYSVPDDADADYVVRMLLDQFAIETSNLNMTTAEGHNMSLFEVVTLASLIEEETAADEERALVSSVIYNRLYDGMKLQIDATVIYALGSSYTGEPVTYDDLEVDSPYNTYLVQGLPAGPICSPSIASLEAAAHPADTNYYYYVLTSTEGYHTFCETEDEFYAAKEEYNRLFGIE